MKKLVLTLCAATVFAGSQVQAETMVQDTDGNGTYSYEEIFAAYDSVTMEDFVEADANGDGALDADELKAAQEAGLIPA